MLTFAGARAAIGAWLQTDPMPAAWWCAGALRRERTALSSQAPAYLHKPRIRSCCVHAFTGLGGVFCAMQLRISRDIGG